MAIAAPLDQNYDVGAHLNEVVQNAGNFPHKCADEKPVFQKIMLWGAAIASPITNKMPQGFFESVH